MKWINIALLAFLSMAALTGVEAPAFAQIATTKVVLSSTAWSDLGVGPLLLSGNGHVVYAVGDASPVGSIPSKEGFLLTPGINQTVNTASHIWAMSNDNFAASVYVTPILAGGGTSSGTSYDPSWGTVSIAWSGSGVPGTMAAWGIAVWQKLDAILVALGNSLAPGDNGVGRFKLWDGTNVMTVKPASTPPSSTDLAGVIVMVPATPGHILSAATNNATSIKATPGILYTLSWLQTTTTLMDIRLYDTASAPTCSSATGLKFNYVVQSNAISAGASLNLGPSGVEFTAGIGICITGANADNDNTNAATGLNVNYTFK